MGVIKKVLVFGTFDIFHEGHRDFLKQAKKQGDLLRVVVARDKIVEKLKKKKPLHDEFQRMKKIEKSGLADEIVFGSLTNPYEIVETFWPDVICLGYDQKFFTDELEKKLEELGLNKAKIVRLEAYKPEIYKSSKLRIH